MKVSDILKGVYFDALTSNVIVPTSFSCRFFNHFIKSRIWGQGGSIIFMKRLFLLVCCFNFLSLFATTEVTQYVLQVGEAKTISMLGSYNNVFISDYSVISHSQVSLNNTFTGLNRGMAYCYYDPSQKPTYIHNEGNPPRYVYIFRVVDVVSITIPVKLDFVIGESYTYTPIITDIEAETTLTWTSSNNDVATVNSNGVVTTVGSGKAIITCTASNGVSAISVINVSSRPVTSVDIQNIRCEIEVDQSSSLDYVVLPVDATNKGIKWMSSNDNIVQVEDDGTIMGISPGYCSVYAIADDGSGKFDRILVHVTGDAPNRADVNGDGTVSISDAVTVVNT